MSSIFSDGFLQDFLFQNLKDPWIGTPFQGYVNVDPKQKGEFGEEFVERFAKRSGFSVDRAPTSTAPYDRIIGGYRTEIKFSLAYKSNAGKAGALWPLGIVPNRFMINHVAKGKEWDRLIFVCINGPEEKDWIVKWFKRDDFITHLNSKECLFRTQQGGKKGGNDDYICQHGERLIEQPWVKDFSEW